MDGLVLAITLLAALLSAIGLYHSVRAVWDETRTRGHDNALIQGYDHARQVIRQLLSPGKDITRVFTEQATTWDTAGTVTVTSAARGGAGTGDPVLDRLLALEEQVAALTSVQRDQVLPQIQDLADTQAEHARDVTEQLALIDAEEDAIARSSLSRQMTGLVWVAAGTLLQVIALVVDAIAG